MMNTRPTRGPRLFNARVALVAILSLVAFGGSFAILSPVASGSTMYVAKQDLQAGDLVAADLFTQTQIKGDFSKAFVIGAEEFNALTGKILLANLRKNDVLRKSDVFTAGGALDPSGGLTGRLTELLTSENQRVVVVMGDATTTFARPGDLLDIYGVLGSDVDAQVTFCFSKKILYAVPRTIPTGADAQDYNPEGTAFVVDLDATEASYLITAQERGHIRVALGSPAGKTVAGSCGTLYAPSYATPTPTPAPTEEPAPTVVP
jgi:hypothetical protein